MAVRKSGKTVLDYDPLSWLKGEEAEGRVEEEPAAAEQDLKGEADAVTESSDKSVEPSSENTPSEPEETATVTAEPAEEPAAPSAEAVQENVEMSDPVDEYFQLDTELTMKNVAEIKDQLDQLMQQDSPVAIDADALRKIDSAGLQMLYSMQKSLAKNGASINWKQESEVIKTAAGIIGMDFDAAPSQQDIEAIEAEQGFGFF